MCTQYTHYTHTLVHYVLREVDTHTHIDLICVYLSIYDVNDMAINPNNKMWQQVIVSV